MHILHGETHGTDVGVLRQPLDLALTPVHQRVEFLQIEVRVAHRALDQQQELISAIGGGQFISCRLTDHWNVVSHGIYSCIYYQ